MTRLISYGGKWKNVHSPKITDCSSHRTLKPNEPPYRKNLKTDKPCVKCGFSISEFEDKCSETQPSGKGCYWHVVCCDHHGQALD